MLDASAPPADAFPSHDDDNASTPAPDSPNTPVNISEHADVKISQLQPDPDALAAPSPLPVKLDASSTNGTAAAHFTSMNPTEEVAADTPMEEEAAHASARADNGAQGNGRVDGADGDVDMKDEPMQTPNGITQPVPNPPLTQSPPAVVHSPLGGSSTTAVDSLPANESQMEEDRVDSVAQQPPAKRARKYSDANMASAHATLVVSTSDGPRPQTFGMAQYKFAVSTIRTLKKQKDATPFKFPVDPVALNIPHYLQVITHPMDLSTIERKLISSNPAKPDPDPLNPRYHNADEFIADVRLIFTNSVTFNGLEHPITLMGKRIEEVFDKQIKHLPPLEEVRAEPSWSARPAHVIRQPKSAPVKKTATPPPSSPAPVKKAAARRPSTSVPTIRRNDSENIGRPKREIHPPPTKELPYANEPKKQRRRSSKAAGSNEQLKYCAKILDQLLSKKQYSYTVAPFAEPVDWVKLNIPDYPRIVKKPMDLGTMRNKLENGEYASADKFRQDFLLIIKNCFEYNAPGTPVNQAGIELQHLFEEKWRGLPALRPQVESEDDEDDDDNESDVERARQIAAMEEQMQSMRDSIEKMKSTALKKTKQKDQVKKKKSVSEPISAPAPSSSKPKKEPKSAPTKKKPVGKKGTVIPDDDVLSFDQKKDLSDTIQNLDGPKLEKVINIIHEGVPGIRESQEEIELEIDSLPAAVLTKLYNYVIRPMRPPPPKKPRTGKGTGTGGLKRKSMDEDVEEAKIRKLEAQMRLFEAQENGSSVSAPPVASAPVKNGHESSDSSSDDDSSGSDSE